MADEKGPKHEKGKEKEGPEFEPEKDPQGHWWHFERCPHDCKLVEVGGQASCPDPPDSPCAKAECRCRLFKRKARKDDPWQHEKKGDDGKSVPEEPGMEYECFCVKRVRAKDK
jgi:hypothetical protein